MALPGFARAVADKVAAGYQALSVSTRERTRVAAALVEVAAAEGRPLLAWLPADGFRVLWRPADDPMEWAASVASPAYQLDIHAAIAAAASEPDFPESALILFLDAHDLLGAPTDAGAVARSTLAHAVDNARFNGGAHARPVVFCHPAARVHPDVDAKLEPVRLPLLTPAEIAGDIVDHVARSLQAPGGPPAATGLEGPGGADLRRRIGEACAGLAVNQVKDVLAECLVRHGIFRPEMLADVRAYRTEAINASGLIRVATPRATFADVGGLGALKQFLGRLGRTRPATSGANPKGVMLYGVPGCGKTLIAEAWAAEAGRLLFHLDIGSLMGGLVGQTEENVRRAFEIIDGAGPSIVLVDEIDKHLAGVRAGGQSDGGVMSRVFGSVLEWLNDHESPAICVMTCNDAAGLPPELARSGRIDALYFVDLPRPGDRDQLWRYYAARYGLDPAQPRPADADYSGADVAACARLACLLDVGLVEAAQCVVPLAVTRKAEIEAMRAAATDRFLDADLGGRYSPARRAAAAADPAAAPAVRAIRRKPRDPSAN